MRHRLAGRKLNRSGAHRKALGRNLFRALITHHRIETTIEKAKAYRPMVEKLITLSKEKNIANIRRAFALVPDRDVVHKLFEEIGPHFKDRPGGYTRILKLSGRRVGDNASRALFELVDLPRAKAVVEDD